MTPLFFLTLVSFLAATGVVVWGGFRRRKNATQAAAEAKKLTPLSVVPQVPSEKKQWLGRRLFTLRRNQKGEKVEAYWRQLEDALVLADVSPGIAHTWCQQLEQEAKRTKQSEESVPAPEELANLLRPKMVQALTERVALGLPETSLHKPFVISLVGVNGVGKTTTAAKLASWFAQQHKQVLLGACDTFRAAASEQLAVWASRTHADLVRGKVGQDPASLAFDAVKAGQARGSDIVLLDTAGRLHTKSGLMDELKRLHRVVAKVFPDAPHAKWLVLDGTLGQNSLQQAQEFHEILGLTGLVLTKMDGTAKGGILFSLVSLLKVPVLFLGVGEKADDLVPFNATDFVDSVLEGAVELAQLS